MANSTMLQLPVAPSVDGSEYAWINQGGVDKRTTLQAIANLATGSFVPTTRSIFTEGNSGLAGGGSLATDLFLSLDVENLIEKTTPTVADTIAMNDAVPGTPVKVTPTNFYKTISGLTEKLVPVATDVAVIYSGADSAARKVQLSNLGIPAGNVPTGGTTGQPLVKSSNANFDIAWQTLPVIGGGTGQISLTNHGVLVGAGTAAITQIAVPASGTLFQGNAGADPSWTAAPTLGVAGVTLGKLSFANLASGSVALQAQTGALGSSVLSLPAATDTLVGKATTDTFTNKTFDTAATGNSLLINGLAATANTGTGAVARAVSPSFTTPNIGAATGTSLTTTSFAGFGADPGFSQWFWVNAGAATNAVSGAFNKTRNATNASRWQFYDIGGLTSDSSGGAFWRGLFLAGPSVTDPVGGAPLFPSASQYWEFNSLSAPSIRNFVIDAGNLTATSLATVKLRSNGADVLSATTTSVSIPQTTASTSTGTGALIVSGGAGIAGVLNIGGTASLYGSTSGSVTLRTQADAGTYNFNLPTSAGTSGQPLLSGGGGATAMTFGTLGVSGGGTGITSAAAGTVLAAATANTISATSSPVLGVAGTTVGTIGFQNATSGTLTLSPTTGALGTSTLTLPATTDTVAVLAASQALTNKTYNGLTITSTTGAFTLTSGKTLSVSNSLTLAGTDSTTMTFPATSSNVLTTGNTATITKGYTVTPNNIGTVSTGTTTPDPTNGNYQYYTNNGAHTLAAPASDCSIDILITNGASAGSITFSGFTVGANTGSALTTTNTNRFIVSIRRINGVSTYSIYALQ